MLAQAGEILSQSRGFPYPKLNLATRHQNRIGGEVMFKKWSFPMLGVAALAVALLSPTTAAAQRHDRDDHHHHRSNWSFSVGVGNPGPYYYGAPYAYAPGYANGYYDSFGY